MKDLFQKKPLSILIVEDEPDFQEVVQLLLEPFSQNLKFTLSASAEEAALHIIKNRYDLILSDYILTGTSTGLYFWELCQKKCPKTPFIMISGFPVQKFINNAHGLKNIPCFISKPFQTDEFLEMVRSSLKAAS